MYTSAQKDTAGNNRKETDCECRDKINCAKKKKKSAPSK